MYSKSMKSFSNFFIIKMILFYSVSEKMLCKDYWSSGSTSKIVFFPNFNAKNRTFLQKKKECFYWNNIMNTCTVYNISQSYTNKIKIIYNFRERNTYVAPQTYEAEVPRIRIRHLPHWSWCAARSLCNNVEKISG